AVERVARVLGYRPAVGFDRRDAQGLGEVGRLLEPFDPSLTELPGYQSVEAGAVDEVPALLPRSHREQGDDLDLMALHTLAQGPGYLVVEAFQVQLAERQAEPGDRFQDLVRVAPKRMEH